MGTVQHHAVLVTCGIKEDNTALENWIRSLPKYQQDQFIIAESPVNYVTNFILIPDGSNDGWPESDKGDELRAKFIAHLESRAYDDGSNIYHYIEVGWGEYGPQVMCSNTTDDVHEEHPERLSWRAEVGRG